MMRVPGMTRRILQHMLVEALGCDVQHTGWPCGTCMMAAGLGDYWQAVLVFRGDYDEYILKADGVRVARLAQRIEFNEDGSFKRHVFADVPLKTLQRQIRELVTRLEDKEYIRHDSNVV